MAKLSRKDVEALRSRWSDEVLTDINTRTIKIFAKAGVWQKSVTMDELRRRFPSHEVNGIEYIDLRGFTFWELREVEWSRVDISYAVFRSGLMGPRLLGGGSIGNLRSRFSECLIDGITMEGNVEGKYIDCSFREARLRRCDFRPDAPFVRCDFAKANLASAKLMGNCFVDCNFVDSNLQRADLSGATFEGCNFDGANMALAGMMSVKFLRCSMKNVKLAGIVSDPKKNVFDGTDIKPF